MDSKYLDPAFWIERATEHGVEYVLRGSVKNMLKAAGDVLIFCGVTIGGGIVLPTAYSIHRRKKTGGLKAAPERIYESLQRKGYSEEELEKLEKLSY